MIDVDNELCPNEFDLNIKDDIITTQFLDPELDEFKCEFGNDGCVKIDTSGYDHLYLSTHTLSKLKELIIEAESIYDIIL